MEERAYRLRQVIRGNHGCRGAEDRDLRHREPHRLEIAAEPVVEVKRLDRSAHSSGNLDCIAEAGSELHRQSKRLGREADETASREYVRVGAKSCFVPGRTATMAGALDLDRHRAQDRQGGRPERREEHRHGLVECEHLWIVEARPASGVLGEVAASESVTRLPCSLRVLCSGTATAGSGSRDQLVQLVGDLLDCELAADQRLLVGEGWIEFDQFIMRQAGMKDGENDLSALHLARDQPV